MTNLSTCWLDSIMTVNRDTRNWCILVQTPIFIHTLGVKVSTRWQLYRVYACYIVCLIVCQPERVEHNSGGCQSLGCTFKLCRPTKFPACDLETYSQWGLWHPYSVIAAPPQDTNQWEKQGVWGWMIFRGYFVQIYWGTTTAKPILASQFLLLFFFPPPPSYSRHSVTFKEHIFESDIRSVTPRGIIFTLSA